MFLSKLFSIFKKKPTDKAVEGPALSGKAQTTIPAAGAAVGGAVGATQESTDQTPQSTASNESPIAMPEPGSSVAMSTPDDNSASNLMPSVESPEPTPTEAPEAASVDSPTLPDAPTAPEEPVTPPSEPVVPPVEAPTEPVQPPEDPTQPAGLA